MRHIINNQMKAKSSHLATNKSPLDEKGPQDRRLLLGERRDGSIRKHMQWKGNLEREQAAICSGAIVPTQKERSEKVSYQIVPFPPKSDRPRGMPQQNGLKLESINAPFLPTEAVLNEASSNKKKQQTYLSQVDRRMRTKLENQNARNKKYSKVLRRAKSTMNRSDKSKNRFKFAKSFGRRRFFRLRRKPTADQFCLVSVRKGKNNTHCSIHRLFGTQKTLWTISGGQVEGSGSKSNGRRKSRYCQRMVFKATVEKLLGLGFKYLVIHCIGHAISKKYVFRNFYRRFQIVLLKDLTTVAHNGCRPRSVRRL